MIGYPGIANGLWWVIVKWGTVLPSARLQSWQRMKFIEEEVMKQIASFTM
jgi:hypothetical protein